MNEKKKKENRKKKQSLPIFQFRFIPELREIDYYFSVGEPKFSFVPSRQRRATAGSKSILRNIGTPEGTKGGDRGIERKKGVRGEAGGREGEWRERERMKGRERMKLEVSGRGKYGKKEILKIATLKRACTPQGIYVISSEGLPRILERSRAVARVTPAGI